MERGYKGFQIVDRKKKKTVRKTKLEGWSRYKRDEVRLKASGTKYEENDRKARYRTYYLSGTRVQLKETLNGVVREIEETDLVSLGKLTDPEISFWKALTHWMMAKNGRECLIETSKRICTCYGCTKAK